MKSHYLGRPADMERNDGDVRATIHVTCIPLEQAELFPVLVGLMRAGHASIIQCHDTCMITRY